MALKFGIATLALGTLLLGSTAAQAEDSVRDWAKQEANRRQDGDRDNDHRDNDRRDDRRDHDRRDDHRDHDRRDDRRDHDRHTEVHVHRDTCRHGPAPLPPPHARGRYELQTVSRYVEGRHEKVWVPEVCREKERRHSRVTKCKGGYYETRWVPGRYEQVQEWVWVSYGRDDDWRSRRTHPATYRP